MGREALQNPERVADCFWIQSVSYNLNISHVLFASQILPLFNDLMTWRAEYSLPVKLEMLIYLFFPFSKAASLMGFIFSDMYLCTVLSAQRKSCKETFLPAWGTQCLLSNFGGPQASVGWGQKQKWVAKNTLVLFIVYLRTCAHCLIVRNPSTN